jgi:alanine racemase
MDYCCIDVGHVHGASVGDRVTLIGSQGDERIALEEVAAHVGTIPYEITCAVGKRVERVYLGGEGTLIPSPRVAAARAFEPGPRAAVL